MRRLTELAHEAVGAVLRPGDLAIDATAGNGHDCVFLADRVGPSGQVIAFDIQPAAIRATRERLRSSGCDAGVQLIEACHSTLGEVLPEAAELRAVMFNLGYLPGSDRQAVTKSTTSLAALATSLERIGQGGIVSVVAYRGHPGGEDEARSIAELLHTLLPSRYSVERHDAPGAGPILWLIRRSHSRLTRSHPSPTTLPSSTSSNAG